MEVTNSQTRLAQLQTSGEESIPAVIARILQNLAEGLTGLATSDRKNLFLSMGYLLQRVRGGLFLQTLQREWEEYRAKGRIDDDYERSEQAYECLQELLDALDTDSPDHIRFEALKQVFLNTATEKFSSRDDLLPQQFMRICRLLNSTEVLILQANYKLAIDGYNPDHYGAAKWIEAILKKSALKFSALVESQEPSLIEKCLIGQRNHSDRSGIVRGKHSRLTDFGYELCRFMEEYEHEPSA